MKLSVKLAVFITILAVVCSGFVAVLSFLAMQERVDVRTSKSIKSLSSTVYSMATTAAYEADHALAQEVVDGLQHNAIIRCASIEARDIHVSSSGACVGTPNLTRDIFFPWDSSELLGKIRIYKNDARVDMLTHEQFLHELATLIKVILVVSGLILVTAYVFVTKPIGRVSQHLSRVKFEEDITLLEEGSRKDELGNISRVINLMLANAKKQIINEKILASKTEELSNSFKLIFQLSKNSLAVTDDSLKLKSFNPRFKSMVSSVLGDVEFLKSDLWLNSVTHNPEGLRAQINSVDEMELPTTREVDIEFEKNGETQHRFYSLTFVKSHSEQVGVKVLFFIYDMTEHRQKLEATEYEASHDNLTHLYNRLAATRKIRHILSSREEGEQVAILFIDLDGFKSINDEFGHEAGDLLLKEIGVRLCKVTRKSDVACRWGGDEFLIALTNINLAQATTTANKILQAIVEPVTLPNVECGCSVGASIGLAISTETISDFSTLYDRADKAMYRVKKTGKNAVLVHGS